MKVRDLIGILVIVFMFISYPLLLGEKAPMDIRSSLYLSPLLGFALYILLALYRRIQLQIEDLKRNIIQKQDYHYQQIEALFSIYNTLEISEPLPPLGGMSLSPEAIHLIILKIKDDRPNLVIELGSGISTVLIGYVLKSMGRGKIISLDHDEQYYSATKRLIKQHRLECWAEVRLAPLKRYKLSKGDWLWYDLDLLDGIETIDMLIIDGPPDHVQRLSRYPALPLLFERIKAGATIFLDDVARASEKETLSLWQGEIYGMRYEMADSEKGLAVISILAER